MSTNGSGSLGRRFGIPLGIVLLSGAAAGAIFLIPDLARDARNFYTQIVILLGILLLSLWLLVLSGTHWAVRIGAIALGAIVLAIIAPNVVWDGDMVPHLRNPLAKHDDEVEKHRREHAANGSVKPLEIQVADTDWPEFRGRKRDGVVVGPKLARDWKTKPPRLVWKQPCGAGWGSFAVAGSLMVTLEQRRDNEAIVAYDAETGSELWKYEYPARFWEAMGGLGPRTTPTIADGDVYSLGAQGHLVCVDARTGSHKWTKQILEDTKNLQWGMAGSPLVVGDKVFVNPGFQGDENSPTKSPAVAGYDRKTGTLSWIGSGGKAGYSSPMVATIDKVRQIILLDGTGISGFSLPSTARRIGSSLEDSGGGTLWNYPWDQTNQDINVAQPLIWESEGRIFISSGYSVGCAMIQVWKTPTGWNCRDLWKNKNKPLRCKMSSPIAYGEFIFGLDEGTLACIAAFDGKLKWKGDRFGHGQLLRCEDLLILLAENGDLVLIEATPDEQRILGRVPAIKAERTWNTPAMANGRIYVRNDREMACFDMRDERP